MVEKLRDAKEAWTIAFAKTNRNRFLSKSVTYLMDRSFYVLPAMRLKLFFLVCALLATGCAHDSDEAQDHPHRHHGGGHRGRETVTEIPDSTPAPSPGPF